jgi:hypothetical protein
MPSAGKIFIHRAPFSPVVNNSGLKLSGYEVRGGFSSALSEFLVLNSEPSLSKVETACRFLA